MMHDSDSAPSCCAFIHRVAFEEVSGLYLPGCFSFPSFWTTEWEVLTGPQGPPCATSIVLLLHIVQQLYNFPPELRPVLLADNSPLVAGSGARKDQGDHLHCQFESESVSHLVVLDSL